MKNNSNNPKIFTALFVFIALIALIVSYSTSYAQILDTTILNVARQGHTATQLLNGKILIIGGGNKDGPVINSEIYDLPTGTFELAAVPIVSRTDHSATILPDGKVLVTGGNNGYPLNSTEIYDPAKDSFSSGPAMKIARVGHTATVLADGRILIVGGDAEGSAEIFDSVSNNFTLLNVSLNDARSSHSAVLLQNGEVLIVGGLALDGSAINSAEIFDPLDMGFSTLFNSMQSARVSPTLRLLPDGKVQVIGGNNDGTMEMFDPDWGVFAANAHVLNSSNTIDDVLGTQSRAAIIDIDGYSLTEMSGLNKALFAGGVDNEGNVLNSAVVFSSSPATITTDKIDYPPGEMVTIIGSGWWPFETVSMSLYEEPTNNTTLLSSTANESGNFTNTDFWTDINQLGVSFMLTTKGQSSGFVAQTAFNDSGSFDYSPSATQNLSATAGGTSVSFVQSVTAPKNNGNFTATVHVAETGVSIPASWVSTSPTTLSFSTGSSPGGTEDTKSWTVSFTVPSGTAAGTYTANIKANPSVGVGEGPGTPVSLTVTAEKRSTSTSVSCTPGSIPVNGSTTCTVTVTDTDSGTKSAPGGTIALATSGTGGFSACTLSAAGSDSSTCTSTYTPTAVGTGTHNITATYTQTDSVHANSNNNASPFALTVTPRTTTTSVSCAPGSIPVNGSTTCTVTVTDTDSGTKSAPGGTIALATSGTGGFTACTLSASSGDTSTCTSTYTPTAVNGGTHDITASYTPTDNVHASSNNNGSPFALTVTLRLTLTTVNLSPDTIVFGEPSTVTVTVTDIESMGTKSNPSGDVTISSSVGSDVFDSTTCTLVASGTVAATCSVTVTPHSASTHTISASYPGSSVHANSSGSAGLTVNPAPTDSTVTVTPNTQQYSDKVTFTATLSPAIILGQAPATSVTFYVGTPDLATAQNMGSCTLTVSDTVLTCQVADVQLLEPSFPPPAPGNMAPGTHTVYAVFGGVNPNFTVNNATTGLTITKEDATVDYDTANKTAVPVSSPGGTSEPFTLIVDVMEKGPPPTGNDNGCTSDDCPGDINNADITMQLIPVGPGSPYTGTCTTTTVGSGYSAVKTLTCNFSSVPVNTYSVVITVNGYYTGGTEEVITVYDPSLGFTTGGGWFYWPGTNDKTNFGYTMKYNKNRTNVQGSLLLIRHLSDGSGKIYRVKSNSLGGLSIGQDTSVPLGWASFNGKATYLDPTMTVPTGNYSFVVYVEDRNEPGTGIDKFWIEVKDPNGTRVEAISLPKPATDNAEYLLGGNIVVPHTRGK